MRQTAALLLAEQREQGVIDLGPGEGASYLVRENRTLLLGRVRRLERYGLVTELETGQWEISDRTEQMLKELGVRNEAIETIRRALAGHGLADERGVAQCGRNGGLPRTPPTCSARSSKAWKPNRCS